MKTCAVCSKKAKFEDKDLCGTHVRTEKKKVEREKEEQRMKQEEEKRQKETEDLNNSARNEIMQFCEDFKKLGNVNDIDIDKMNEFIKKYKQLVRFQFLINLKEVKEKPEKGMESKFAAFALFELAYKRYRKTYGLEKYVVKDLINCFSIEKENRIKRKDWKCPKCGGDPSSAIALDGGSATCSKCPTNFHWCALVNGYSNESPLH